MILQAFLLISLVFFTACSPKRLFPTDNKEYCSISDYKYNYTEHTFTSQDGTPLYGIHIKPKKRSKGMIVVANGIYKNMSWRFTQWLWIVESGYEVFIFDYRGFGKSQSEPDMYGFRDDVNAGIEYAHRLYPKEDMVVVGQSMGGTFVIDALAYKKYDYVKLVVADSTFTSFASTLNSFMLKTIILIPFSWLPYTFSPDDLNSIENISKLETPILFLTGDEDWVVHYSNSLKLFEKAEGAKMLWIVKGAGHVEGLKNIQAREAFLELLQKREINSFEKRRYF